MSSNTRKQSGFTLIECLTALVITLVGVLSVFQLISYSIKIDQFAVRSTEATTLAVNKVEELKLSSLTNGGSLTSNVTGYSDNTSNFYVLRWTIADGAVGVGTKKIVVDVLPKYNVTDNSKIRIETLVR